MRHSIKSFAKVNKDQRTLERNGTVRIAPGFFTDDEDIEQAIKGVSEIAGYEASS